MKSHDEFIQELLSAPGVKNAYDEMEKQVGLLEKLVVARVKAGLSQADVAKSMGTSTPAISRIESCRHSPKWSTLVGYADAIGFKLEVRLVPVKAKVKRPQKEVAQVKNELAKTNDLRALKPRDEIAREVDQILRQPAAMRAPRKPVKAAKTATAAAVKKPAKTGSRVRKP